MPIAIPQPQTMVSAETFGQPVANELNRINLTENISFVPVVSNDATVVATTAMYSVAWRVGNFCHYEGQCSITGTGVVGAIMISLPYPIRKTGNGMVGNFYMYDNSAGSNTLSYMVAHNNGKVTPLQTTGYLNTALGPNDFLTWNLNYMIQ